MTSTRAHDAAPTGPLDTIALATALGAPVTPSPRRSSLAPGIVIMLVSAAAFAMSGPFVKPLLAVGWSPGSATMLRTAGAAVILFVPALLALRGRWSVLRRRGGLIAAYGVVAVVGTQLGYFSAIEYLPVGVALLIEYLAPVILVLVGWVISRRHPGALTLAGSGLAIIGLVLVLDLAGASTPDLRGVAWAAGAAISLCGYYVLSARSGSDLPPVVLAGGGMVVATGALGILGATGLVPLRASTADVVLLGNQTSWLVPALVIVGISTVAGYLLGIAGSARVGSRLASFLGLTEVLFAVITAWLLLGDVPGPVQIGGGALILLGVVLVKAQPTRLVA